MMSYFKHARFEYEDETEFEADQDPWWDTSTVLIEDNGQWDVRE